jgi:hypothetical protein
MYFAVLLCFKITLLRTRELSNPIMLQALKPFLEGLLFNGLERFVAYAKQQYSKTLQS